MELLHCKSCETVITGIPQKYRILQFWKCNRTGKIKYISSLGLEVLVQSLPHEHTHADACIQKCQAHVLQTHLLLQVCCIHPTYPSHPVCMCVDLSSQNWCTHPSHICTCHDTSMSPVIEQLDRRGMHNSVPDLSIKCSSNKSIPNSISLKIRVSIHSQCMCLYFVTCAFLPASLKINAHYQYLDIVFGR